MNDKSKKVFLAVCIIVPFVVYCVYYYGIMVKNAPYKFSEFKSITLQYGLGDKLVNQYDSKSGLYQYINDKDSLVQTHIKLSKDELLYLHRKAAELGFWNFPEVIAPDKATHASPAQYNIEFAYERKSKHVLFNLDYNKDTKLKDAISQLIKEVSTMLSDAQDRANKAQQVK